MIVVFDWTILYILCIRCWVAALGFLQCKEWDNMKCVCGGCTLCYISVYQWAQTSSHDTNRPVQYSIDRTYKHQYNTAYSHYTHTSYYLICYSAENHMLQLNI